MSCLDDKVFVGLRDSDGYDLIETTTGYYVDELPGLNLSVVAAGQSSESSNAQAEIQKHIDLAKKIVSDRVRSHLKSRYSVDTNVETRTTGIYSTKTAQAASAYWVGQNIRIRDNANAELHVSDLNLVVNTTGTVTIKAFDLFSGQELQSKDITVSTAGIPVAASLDWTFLPKSTELDIFIGYDATSVASYTTPIQSGWCHSCKGGIYRTKYAEVYAKKSATGSNPTTATISGANGTAGLSLRWGVNCSADPLLCGMGDILALPMWHRVGWSLANMMRYSKRLSPDVLNYDGDYEELTAYFNDEFEGAMAEILKNARIPQNDCFRCQSATQVQVKV